MAVASPTHEPHVAGAWAHGGAVAVVGGGAVSVPPAAAVAVAVAMAVAVAVAVAVGAQWVAVDTTPRLVHRINQ